MSDTQSFTNLIHREAGIRKALLVYGNITDLAYNQQSQTYQRATDVIVHTLLARGYHAVMRWDRVSGLKTIGGNASLTEDVLNAAVQGNNKENAQGDYFQDEEFADSIPAMEAQTQKMDAKSFFSIVYHQLVQPGSEKIAFVVDWSDYLFGEERGLTGDEREWLTLIAKAIAEAPIRTDLPSTEGLSSLIVFLTNNLSRIPHYFYQNNSMVKQINIPLPSRKERKAYLNRMGNLSRLNVSPIINEDTLEEFIDLLDGFTIQDIEQLIRLSRHNDTTLTGTKLVNLYKYGEKTSPWEELSKDRLKTIEATLKQRVKGQDEAVAKVTNVVIRAYTGFSGLQHAANTQKPKGTLFFVGPTGVGKTELAKALAQFLFGDENACIRFDMSEYSSEHSDQRLIGAPPGYVGFEQGGQLTNALKQKPFSVLLFDEIEKAHPRIMDKFLQILEDGRLTDGKGETVHFAQSIIIFTSNIGAAEVVPREDRLENERAYKAKIKEHFSVELGRPELLNRIGDNVVVFNSITNADFLIQIARAKLEPIRQFLQEKYKVKLAFNNEEIALKAIAQQTDLSHGGRGILNQLESSIVNPLSNFIFENEELLLPNTTVQIVQFGQGPVFEFMIGSPVTL